MSSGSAFCSIAGACYGNVYSATQKNMYLPFPSPSSCTCWSLSETELQGPKPSDFISCPLLEQNITCSLKKLLIVTYIHNTFLKNINAHSLSRKRQWKHRQIMQWKQKSHISLAKDAFHNPYKDINLNKVQIIKESNFHTWKKKEKETKNLFHSPVGQNDRNGCRWSCESMHRRCGCCSFLVTLKT